MGNVVSFPADKAGAPPPGALEAEVLRLRRIAARAYDTRILASLIRDALTAGHDADQLAVGLRAHLMAE